MIEIFQIFSSCVMGVSKNSYLIGNIMDSLIVSKTGDDDDGG